jgi:predicted MFS family arabinose efflux permease
MTATARHDSFRTTLLLAAAAVILSITTGIRQSMGLFANPIVTTTGVSIASISFALAVGQFMWGAAQPLFGAIADQYGASRILMAGGLLMALGAALARYSASELGFALSLGVVMAVGAAAGSFAVLIGVSSQLVPPEKRSFASGVINAGGSLGQLVFAPFSQFVISRSGWNIGLLALSLSALVTVPLAWLFRRSPEATDGSTRAERAAPILHLSLREQLRVAMRDRSYLYLHAGFFTCGFHIAFLVTHLPGDLQLCGLAANVAANSIAIIGAANVIGSLSVGWLGGRHRMKHILAWLYATRAAVIVCYLLMPKTALNVYLVAAALGVSWLATVPPTAGLVGKLFGTRYLTTLFGLTLLSHQIGGFFGAWLGGVAMAQLGSYQWVWYADIGLALAAAVVSLPIREAAIMRPAVRAAGA